MIRFVVALAAALLNGPASFASGPIDLDAPATLEVIQRNSPDHFWKTQRILAEMPRGQAESAIGKRYKLLI